MIFSKVQREGFFLLIFQNEFNGGEVDENGFADILYSNDKYSEEDCLFIIDNLKEYFYKKEAIDNYISENLKNWSLDRIGKVELALLRAYCYETGNNELDKVVVNHILNLGKKYGSEDSNKFINGVIKNLENNKYGI